MSTLSKEEKEVWKKLSEVHKSMELADVVKAYKESMQNAMPNTQLEIQVSKAQYKDNYIIPTTRYFDTIQQKEFDMYHGVKVVWY